MRGTVTSQLCGWKTRFLLGVMAAGVFVAPLGAQAPPPQEPPKPAQAEAAVPAQPAIPIPEKVVIAPGTAIEVVLDTPMSTRISKPGQEVVFRTIQPLRLSEGLVLPPETAFIGTVTTMQKPGAFGKSGELRVKVEHIELAQNARTPVAAHLESVEMDSRGRLRADNQSGANLFQLAQWTLTGTIIGANYGGGKGAGYGAGAGALAALILLMSRKGSDVYVEPGTPFQVVLEQPLELDGQQVMEAQVAFDKLHPGVLANTGVSSDSSPGVIEGIPPGERPVLKRRPKPKP